MSAITQKIDFYSTPATVSQSSISISFCWRFIHVNFYGVDSRYMYLCVITGCFFWPIHNERFIERWQSVKTILLLSSLESVLISHSLASTYICCVSVCRTKMTVCDFINTINGLVNFYGNYKTIYPFFVLCALCNIPFVLHVLLTYHFECTYVFQLF